MDQDDLIEMWNIIRREHYNQITGNVPKRSIKEKALELQNQIETKYFDLSWLDMEFYLLLCSIFMIFTGLGLFIFCLIANIPIALINVLTHPLLYLIIGMLLCICYILQRYRGVFDGI